jgi:hypothetical protein
MEDIMTETVTQVVAVSERWTAMWNGELRPEEVVAPGCRVYFGREPRLQREPFTTGPVELAAVVDGIRGAIPGVRYWHESDPLFQASEPRSEDGLITLLWKLEAPGFARRSGIDILRTDDGGVTEVWSVTGDLELPGF